MTSTGNPQKRRIKRHTVSERDGTREGGLVFCIALMCGMIVASVVHPLALTSFWVWVAMLVMAAGVAVSVQKIIEGISAS